MNMILTAEIEESCSSTYGQGYGNFTYEKIKILCSIDSPRTRYKRLYEDFSGENCN
jgi:hypothetical protein